MFTGIVTDLGKVRALEKDGDTRIEFDTAYDTADIEIGASIACSGPCLTVVAKGPGWFAVEASAETLSRTNLGGWNVGTPVNLERAMRVGDELGGHIVSGHVDGVATVREAIPEGDSIRYRIEAPQSLARFIAPKGSIALDGVSLTVNDVDGAIFDINVIPHTQKHTSLGAVKAGDRLNVEIDTIARYVARLLERE